MTQNETTPLRHFKKNIYIWGLTLTIMHLRICLLLTFAFSLFGPLALKAQEKKGDFEFNIGISTPGLYSIADTENKRYSAPGVLNFYALGDWTLSDLSKESYNSTLFPSVSAEISYRLADAGFFKRLSVVGYTGLHVAYYQDVNVVYGTKDTKEFAIKMDCLLGVRYHIVDGTRCCMYTQAFLGKEIRNGCDYWDVTGNVVNRGELGERDICWHLTFLGFRFKPKNGNVGFMTELGYGSEYCLGSIPVFPGVRIGASYLF